MDPESNDELDRWKFDIKWRFENLPDHERLSVLRSICPTYDIELVHFRSLICIAPEYLAAAKELGLGVIFSFHDFYAICPTIQLIDDRGQYCGGVCSSGGGECRLSKTWFSNSPALKHAYVYRWRERVRAGLRVCDAFITTSRSARDTLTTYYPTISHNLHVIEHGRDDDDDAWISVPPTDSPIRIACIGALGQAKGASLLKSIFELNAKRREVEPYGIPFEFHVFGPVDSQLEAETPGVMLHGPYERAALRDLVAKVQPSFSLICSIWPETYCHTLTESWHFGLPVFASDIGTIKERIHRHGGGWLLDYSHPEDWFRRMLEIASDTTTYSNKIEEIREMRFRTVSEMAQDYEQLYRGVLSAIDQNGVMRQDSLSG